jgi:heat shock protein HslJ
MNIGQIPLPTTTLTAFFGAEFTFSGNSGCNAFSGGYSLSGSAIAINPLASGLASCGEEVDQQEQQYFSLLRSVTSYELIETQLILYSGGQEILRFNQS